MAAGSPPRYRVTAAMVYAKTATAGSLPNSRNGLVMIQVYAGSMLPADTPQVTVDRYLAQGVIEEVVDA